jgi:hypothetical protein
MITWEQVSFVLSLVAAGLLGMHLTTTPEVSAQTVRPAMVRSVDEPARVPYQITAAPTCPFQHECFISGPTVRRANGSGLPGWMERSFPRRQEIHSLRCM